MCPIILPLVEVNVITALGSKATVLLKTTVGKLTDITVVSGGTPVPVTVWPISIGELNGTPVTNITLELAPVGTVALVVPML